MQPLDCRHMLTWNFTLFYMIGWYIKFGSTDYVLMDRYVDNDTYVEYAKQDISTSWKKSLTAIITKWLIHQLYYSNVHVSAITHLPRMFLPSDLLSEYCIELVAMELLCITFIFTTRIFCRVFQVLWLVILAVFGVMDLPLVPYMLVYFWQIYSWWVGLSLIECIKCFLYYGNIYW